MIARTGPIVSSTMVLAFAGNLLLGGLIGAGVDSYTGAAREFKPNPLKVTLEC